MSLFDEYCDRINALPIEVKAKHIEELSKAILPALQDIADSGKIDIDCVSVYLDFVLAAIGADGKLTVEEFALTKPFFDSVAECDTTYEDGLRIFNETGLSDPSKYKNAVDLMVDLLGLVSEDLKDAIVSLTLFICAIDGEITDSEKQWILQLIDDNFGYDPMEEIDDFLGEAGTFTLATLCDGKPRMRALGFKVMIDGKIFFSVGTFKEVYKQLVADPRCELLAYKGTKFLRWNGKAVFYEDDRFMKAATEAMPQVVQMYKNMGAKLAFFTVEDGEAEFVYVDNTKETLF